jgi:hypothetical protein
MARALLTVLLGPLALSLSLSLSLRRQARGRACEHDCHVV